MQRYFQISFTLFNYSTSEREKKSQVEYHSDTMNIGDSFAGVKQPEL
jgi:hypothetical protein